jgi:hypothetical protein
MMTRKDFAPTSTTGLAMFIDRYGLPGLAGASVNAVDGGLIVVVDPQDQTRSSTIGGWLLSLDDADDRTGLLHTILDQLSPEAECQSTRASEIERYIANVLVASRKLDVVHLIRQGVTIDYREQGRLHDERLERTLAAIRARKGTA